MERVAATYLDAVYDKYARHAKLIADEQSGIAFFASCMAVVIKEKFPREGCSIDKAADYAWSKFAPSFPNCIKHLLMQDWNTPQECKELAVKWLSRNWL